jgi:D-alanyl-D-alanine carboxypeptidase (penicillin-binding protein 5/6)
MEDELISEYNILASNNVDRVNIISRLIKSFNFLIWGDV